MNKIIFFRDPFDEAHLMFIVLTFYYDDHSSNPAEV